MLSVFEVDERSSLLFFDIDYEGFNRDLLRSTGLMFSSNFLGDALTVFYFDT